MTDIRTQEIMFPYLHQQSWLNSLGMQIHHLKSDQPCYIDCCEVSDKLQLICAATRQMRMPREGERGGCWIPDKVQELAHIYSSKSEPYHRVQTTEGLVTAHQIVAWAKQGPWTGEAGGGQVVHIGPRCSVKANGCVNPDHIKLGTSSENNQHVARARRRNRERAGRSERSKRGRAERELES